MPITSASKLTMGNTADVFARTPTDEVMKSLKEVRLC